MHSTGDNQPKKGSGYFASRLKEKGSTEETNPAPAEPEKVETVSSDQTQTAPKAGQIFEESTKSITSMKDDVSETAKLASSMKEGLERVNKIKNLLISNPLCNDSGICSYQGVAIASPEKEESPQNEEKIALEAAQPEQNRPAQMLVQNLSNVPETFRVTWSSPEDSLNFEPQEPQPINVPSGEKGKLKFTLGPTRRPWFGGERGYPYTVEVQSSDQQSQKLEGEIKGKGLLPTWALVAGVVVLLLVCLVGVWLLPGIIKTPTSTMTPTLTNTVTVPVPTATQSQVDLKPLLIETTWYLVAYNDTYSRPGVQEAYILFNSNDTLIGYTGCKDLSGSYQTNFNQIRVYQYQSWNRDLP